jgi:hypothetical protein
VAPVSIIAGVLIFWLLVVLCRQRLRESLPATAPPPSQAAAVAEWVILFLMVGINLFWIATDYSVAVGKTRAREWAAQLPTSSQVVIYSEKELHLSGPDVRTASCGKGRSLLTYDQLQRDVVRVAEFQNVHGTEIFHPLVRDAEFIEQGSRRIEIRPSGEGEGEVVESYSIFIELVAGDRAKPEQRITHLVDHTAEEEPESRTGGFVRVRRTLPRDRPSEDGVIEGPGSLDVGHCQANMVERTGGNRHDQDPVMITLLR